MGQKINSSYRLYHNEIQTGIQKFQILIIWIECTVHCWITQSNHVVQHVFIRLVVSYQTSSVLSFNSLLILWDDLNFVILPILRLISILKIWAENKKINQSNQPAFLDFSSSSLFFFSSSSNSSFIFFSPTAVLPHVFSPNSCAKSASSVTRTLSNIVPDLTWNKNKITQKLLNNWLHHQLYIHIPMQAQLGWLLPNSY